MTDQWTGRESDHKAEERVRVCTSHRRICAVDEERDRVMCPAGHLVRPTEDTFAVMTRSKAEAMEGPRGGLMAKPDKGKAGVAKVAGPRSIESQAFLDGAGWRLRLTLRAHKGRFEVFVFHLSPDQKIKKGGVLHAVETEGVARTRFEAEVAAARKKGWAPSLNRRGGGGLKEIPEPKPALGVRRTA